MSSPTSPLPKRRNGKLQSCEPCRKAKAACDHNVPKCNRCVRRGISGLCLYHPSPMTRTVDTAPSSARTPHESLSVPVATSATDSASNILLLLSQQRSPEYDQGTTDNSRQFLGPTSYSAVFRENQASIGADLWDPHDEEMMQNQTSMARESADTASHKERLELGVRALMNFPNQALCERFMDRFFATFDVQLLHEPSMRFCLTSVWSTYGKLLTVPRDPTLVRQMAEKLLSNGSLHPPVCKTAAEWLQSFTGNHLRFEIIGTYFAIFGLAVIMIPEWDPLFTSDRDGTVAEDKRVVAKKLGENAETCQFLCSDNAPPNEFTVWLMHHLQILQSLWSGDERGFLWRKSGHVATAITALGFHRENISAAPFMVSELRRRTFASAFIADKQIATFTGRPPRLSRRYSNCQLPLDLDDEQLMLDGEQRSQMLATLDENGWNKSAFTHATALRGLMIMSLIRDEILELCLGPAHEYSHSRRDEVKRRSEESYNNLPALLKFKPDLEVSATNARIYTKQVILSLEFLLNRYLLERLPNDETQRSKQALINTAAEMLNRFMILMTIRGKLADYLYDFAWAIIYFGLPSAGVLSIELLKQSQYPQRYGLSLPRSEVIQNLSTFIFCLGTIGPADGTYTICSRMRRVINRILNRVLEPLPIIQANDVAPSTTDISNQPISDNDIRSMMEPIEDPEFIDWLNSVDWRQGPWADML